jgi:hypothetical protein
MFSVHSYVLWFGLRYVQVYAWYFICIFHAKVPLNWVRMLLYQLPLVQKAIKSVSWAIVIIKHVKKAFKKSAWYYTEKGLFYWMDLRDNSLNFSNQQLTKKNTYLHTYWVMISKLTCLRKFLRDIAKSTSTVQSLLNA